MSNQLEELLKKLKQQTQQSLQKEVAEEVKNTMKEHIKMDVYSAYEPSAYQRRKENGGLLDDENINVTPTENGIIVTNDTMGRDFDEVTYSYYDVDKRLDAVIEYGDEYEWTKSKIYKNQPFPRPFIENTRDELSNNGKCEEILKDSLKRKGWSVK